MATLTLKKPSARALKPLSKEARIAKVKHHLMRKYPDLFPAGEPVVLAIGIHKKLSRPEGASLLDMRRFLKSWTTREVYLQQIARGGPRQSPAGKSGEITPKQIKIARFMLKRMRKQ